IFTHVALDYFTARLKDFNNALSELRGGHQYHFAARELMCLQLKNVRLLNLVNQFQRFGIEDANLFAQFFWIEWFHILVSGFVSKVPHWATEYVSWIILGLEANEVAQRLGQW
ncbi:hypothetical protein ACJX0J_020012, partial [Zea mays]